MARDLEDERSVDTMQAIDEAVAAMTVASERLSVAKRRLSDEPPTARTGPRMTPPLGKNIEDLRLQMARLSYKLGGVRVSVMNQRRARALQKLGR